MRVSTIGDNLVEVPQIVKKRLPTEKHGFVLDLLLEEEQANAATASLIDQIAQNEQKRAGLAERLHKLAGQGFPKLTDAEPQIANLKAGIAECLDAMERLRPRAHQHSMTASNNNLLVRNLVKYFQSIATDARLGKPVAAPKLKGESFDEAIEAKRRRDRELVAKGDKLRAAPLHSSVAKAKSTKWIEDLAARGAPDAFDAIETNGAMKWPVVTFNEFFPVVGRIKIETPDTMAILCHLFRAQMIAAANDAIDAAADDEAALSDADRARLIGEVERDRLAGQREEVALIKAAKAAGQSMLFRPDTDPRALLDLADDIPAPRE